MTESVWRVSQSPGILEQRNLCSVNFPVVCVIVAVFTIMGWGFVFVFCLAYLSFSVVKNTCGDTAPTLQNTDPFTSLGLSFLVWSTVY